MYGPCPAAAFQKFEYTIIFLFNFCRFVWPKNFYYALLITDIVSPIFDSAGDMPAALPRRFRYFEYAIVLFLFCALLCLKKKIICFYINQVIAISKCEAGDMPPAPPPRHFEVWYTLSFYYYLHR